MKTNAIIRIILFSIVIFILLGILITGLLWNSLHFTYNHQQRWESGETVQSGGSGTASANITSIKIQWVSGTITILPGDTDAIVFQESQVTKEEDQLVAKENGNTLIIQYWNQSRINPLFGIHVDISKDLTITVPRDMILKNLEIEAASAEVNIQNLIIQDMAFEGASAICSLENCKVDELDVETASGDIYFSGQLKELDCSAASANFHGQFTNVPSRIDMDSMSGDLDISLPEGCGFTVTMDALSSNFSSDFPTVSQNGNHIYGDGYCKIEMDAMSGDVRIRKE